MKKILILFAAIVLQNCHNSDSNPNLPSDEIYFPPVNSEDWETTTTESLNWNSSAIDELYDFLEQNGSRAFIVLKNGKIVLEKYWGNNATNTEAFNKNTNWYWASAGKTLTAVLTGIAQQEGDLNINDKTSDYLGTGWSSLPADKEDLILVRHQLTMTTGLDYDITNPDCTEASCLQYKVDAGNQWYYHNAPYTLIESVVGNAVGMGYNDYTDLKIESKIGMVGSWLPVGDNNVYFSTARGAARFGLLLLNKGIWDKMTVLSDNDYFESMTNSSQTLNPSYGYLTWLNGKSSIILPGLPISFNFPLSSNAPDDLYAALGKNGQFIDVVPGEGLVVIRMGDASDGSLVPTVFHDDMWEKINAVIN